MGSRSRRQARLRAHPFTDALDEPARLTCRAMAMVGPWSAEDWAEARVAGAELERRGLPAFPLTAVHEVSAGGGVSPRDAVALLASAAVEEERRRREGGEG